MQHYNIQLHLHVLQKMWKYCYWQKRRGTAEEAIKYCTKEDTRVAEGESWGNPSGVAAKNEETDFQLICKKISTGEMSVREVAIKSPDIYVKHCNGLNNLACMTAKPRMQKTKIIVMHGMPECGKTREAFAWALEHYEEHNIYKYDQIADNGTEWWQAYSGQKCIVLDEMMGKRFAFHRLLTIIDRYPTIVGLKGASYQLNPDVIIFTSNYPPNQWYNPTKHFFDALRRRIDECYKIVLLIDKKGKPVVDEEDNLQYRLLLDPENMRGKNVGYHNDRIAELNINNGYTAVYEKEVADDDLVVDSIPAPEHEIDMLEWEQNLVNIENNLNF